MLMWIVENVPYWAILVLLAIGGAGGLIGRFAGFMPIVGSYFSTIRTTSLLVGMLGVWFAGAVFVSDDWKERVAAAEAKALEIQKQSAEENLILADKIRQYEAQLKEKQRVRTEYITKYITQYDNRCDLPNATISVLSAAAENRVPPSPAQSDGASSDVKISDVVQNTSDNYATCYEFRGKLIEWQNWYTTQKKIFNQQ